MTNILETRRVNTMNTSTNRYIVRNYLIFTIYLCSDACKYVKHSSKIIDISSELNSNRRKPNNTVGTPLSCKDYRGSIVFTFFLAGDLVNTNFVTRWVCWDRSSPLAHACIPRNVKELYSCTEIYWNLKIPILVMSQSSEAAIISVNYC